MKNSLISCYFIFALIWLPSASATSVLPLSLEQLSTRASLIFYAEVISNHTRLDESSGRIATFTEFNIIELIKGETKTTHTIKQIGGYDPISKTRLFIHGVPTFQVGRTYVLFLPTESTLGFSSPLGLFQGSYRVKTINGEKIVSNGRNLDESTSVDNSSAITIPLAIDAHRPSQARLDNFINTIRSHNTP
jgi:hypothetical protein